MYICLFVVVGIQVMVLPRIKGNIERRQLSLPHCFCARLSAQYFG